MIKKKKILNLYGGLGGNVKELDNNLYEITTVEKDSKIAIAYQLNNPTHKVVVGDALEYLLNHYSEYDIVWASPTCQSHGRMVKATRHKIKKMPDMSLYQVIIFLTHFFKGGWIVENVKPYYEPLIKPTAIIGRHVFWSNFRISNIEVKNLKGFINNTNTKGAEALKKHLGIKYEGNIYYDGNHCPAQVLRNCVPPKLGLHIINEYELNGVDG